MITEETIQKVLQAKIDILVGGLLSEMKKAPEAIYLVGGYGRGEGAWYEDAEGIHPYNDFDLAVITDTPLNKETTESLRKQLALSVDIKWVDIDYYSIYMLEALLPTIHNVDLLKGGSLVYGQDIIKQKRLTLDESKIGKKDILILYWTRMWTFLGSWTGPFRDLEISDARFFRNQMAKAVLAACDMILVKHKQYVTSYRERVGIIKKMFSEDNTLCNLVEWSLSEKLRPSSTPISQDEMTTLYFSVKDFYIKSFAYSFGPLSFLFLNPHYTKFYYFFFTKDLLRHFYYLLKRHKSSVLRSNDISCAMNLVFLSNKKGMINNRMLIKASKILLKRGFCETESESWDDLRYLAAYARNNA